MTGPLRDIDPITLEVVTESLVAIVREMRASIIRSSYSSAIYEFDDFSVALFGPTGELVSQSWDHPGHVLPLPWGVRCAIEDFAGDLHPGDVVLLNDPYRGGTHLNDVTLIFPVFDQAGSLMIFPAVRSHWVDVGGMVPGSYSGLSTNIYQEGVRIPPIKLYDRGVPNKAALTLLMANMRIPDEREGDLNASLGACRVAEQRIRKLVARYGWDVVDGSVRLHLDRTERRMRERITELPDGDYFYEDYLEFFNEGKLDPVIVRLKLTVAGDQITADFDGTNPQVPGVVNCSLAVAGAGVFVAIKSTLDPGGSVNAGAFRPIRLLAPPATIFSVQSDAPAGAHGEVRKRGVSVTLGALSQMIPDLVSGDLCGSTFPNSIGGYNAARGRHYLYYEAPVGGTGGFREGDGASVFGNIDFGNLPSIHNAEVVEDDMPLLVERCTLRVDAGGEGAHRGGVGMHRDILLLQGEASYSVLSDRAVIPPYGMLGGGNALQYHLTTTHAGEEREFATPGKITGFPLVAGDRVTMRSSGGGGYGDPLDRDPLLVLEDLLSGYVSRDRAHAGYGVVLDERDEVDHSATATRRDAMRADRFFATAVMDAALVPYVGRKGRRRVIDLCAGDAARLGVMADSLVELRGRHPAPLRAWVRLGRGAPLPAGSIPMDPFGAKVLGIADGGRVQIVPLTTPDLPHGMAH